MTNTNRILKRGEGAMTNLKDPATSLGGNEGYKPVPKTVVADNSTANMIAGLRNQLQGGGPIEITGDGTIKNPKDPATSLGGNEGYKPVPKTVVANYVITDTSKKRFVSGERLLKK